MSTYANENDESIELIQTSEKSDPIIVSPFIPSNQ